MICFNVAEKDRRLTWEQFKELAANEQYVHYTVQNIDSGSMYIDMNHCDVDFSDVDDSCFTVCSLFASVEIDKEIVNAIYNDAIDSERICYRLEFNNGMTDMIIEPEQDVKVF